MTNQTPSYGMRFHPKIGPILFCVFAALVLMGLGLKREITEWRLLLGGAEAEAAITGVSARRGNLLQDELGATIYRYAFETAEGATVTGDFVRKVSRQAPLFRTSGPDDAGTRGGIPVRYVVANPDRHRFGGAFDGGRWLFWAGVALLFAAFGLYRWGGRRDA